MLILYEYYLHYSLSAYFSSIYNHSHVFLHSTKCTVLWRCWLIRRRAWYTLHSIYTWHTWTTIWQAVYAEWDDHSNTYPVWKTIKLTFFCTAKDWSSAKHFTIYDGSNLKSSLEFVSFGLPKSIYQWHHSDDILSFPNRTWHFLVCWLGIYTYLIMIKMVIKNGKEYFSVLDIFLPFYAE
jgi:hypothetical protein